MLADGGDFSMKALNATDVEALIEIALHNYSIKVHKKKVLKVTNRPYDKRVIVLVNEKLVLKLFCNDWYTPDLCDSIINLMQVFQENGIPYAKNCVTREGKGYHYFLFEGKHYFSFLEYRIEGSNGDQVKGQQAFVMGSTLSKMHILGKGMGPKVQNCDSLYGLFTRSSSRNASDLNYENMRSFVSALHLERNRGVQKEVEDIWKKYMVIRLDLMKMWEELPRTFTTNDFLLKNLVLSATGIQGIYDFHLACTKVVVYDFVQTALYNFRIITESGVDAVNCRLYEQFCDGYFSHYRFQAREEEARVLLCRLLATSWKSYLMEVTEDPSIESQLEKLKFINCVLSGGCDSLFVT